MAKRPPSGKCVHCLADPVPRTWDHMFPVSWYPDTTPPNLEKWKIPVCHRCNQEYGRIEQYLLPRIGLCLEPDAPESAGIVPKVLRSLDPNHGRNENDKRVRERTRAAIIKHLVPAGEIRNDSIYPGFEERWGLPPDHQLALPVGAEKLNRFAQKIVRGIYYVQDGKFIEPPYDTARN